MIFRLTEELFRLTEALFRLTGVTFRHFAISCFKHAPDGRRKNVKLETFTLYRGRGLRCVISPHLFFLIINIKIIFNLVSSLNGGHSRRPSGRPALADSRVRLKSYRGETGVSGIGACDRLVKDGASEHHFVP